MLLRSFLKNEVLDYYLHNMNIKIVKKADQIEKVDVLHNFKFVNKDKSLYLNDSSERSLILV